MTQRQILAVLKSGAADAQTIRGRVGSSFGNEVGIANTWAQLNELERKGAVRRARGSGIVGDPYVWERVSPPDPPVRK